MFIGDPIVGNPRLIPIHGERGMYRNQPWVTDDVVIQHLERLIVD